MNGIRTDNIGLNCPALHLPTYQLLNLACGASETSQMTTGDGLHHPRPEAEPSGNALLKSKECQYAVMAPSEHPAWWVS